MFVLHRWFSAEINGPCWIDSSLIPMRYFAWIFLFRIVFSRCAQPLSLFKKTHSIDNFENKEHFFFVVVIALVRFIRTLVLQWQFVVYSMFYISPLTFRIWAAINQARYSFCFLCVCVTKTDSAHMHSSQQQQKFHFMDYVCARLIEMSRNAFILLSKLVYFVFGFYLVDFVLFCNSKCGQNASKRYISYGSKPIEINPEKSFAFG